jgi:hypothetical protein
MYCIDNIFDRCSSTILRGPLLAYDNQIVNSRHLPNWQGPASAQELRLPTPANRQV